MQKHLVGEDCRMSIGSMTAALRAQRMVRASAIRCEVIKTEEGSARRGCMYGILFPCYHEQNVRRILSDAGIRGRRGGEKK